MNSTKSVLVCLSGPDCHLVLSVGWHKRSRRTCCPTFPEATSPSVLQPIVTGMAAPDYAISPPGDLERLFVVEQNGLLQIIQNGSLLPAPALDIQSRSQPPLNPGQRQRRARLPRAGVSSGLQRPEQPRLPHALHLQQRADPGRDVADLSGAQRCHAKLQERDQRMEDERRRTRTSSIPPRAARSSRSARTRATTTAARSRSVRTATCTWRRATAATPTTSARATSSRAATPRT